MRKLIYPFIMFFVCSSTISFAQDRFEGKVVTPETEKTPQVVIKMTPPRTKQSPQQITISDDEGNFQFNKIEQGRYLMEVYHNNELIRREVVDTHETKEKEIELVPER